jgi:hypothetical protein
MRLSAVQSFDSEIAVRVAGLNGPEEDGLPKVLGPDCNIDVA